MAQTAKDTCCAPHKASWAMRSIQGMFTEHTVAAEGYKGNREHSYPQKYNLLIGKICSLIKTKSRELYLGSFHK